MKEKSSYTIEKSDTGYIGGRYISNNPYNAAKKAASQLFRRNKKKSKVITFTLRETTSGSNKKEFKYKAKQIKLKKPIILNIKGNTITYNYKIEIESLNKIEKKTKINPKPKKQSTPKKYIQGGGCSSGGGVCSLP